MIRSLDGAISSLARCLVITVVVGLFNITISAQTANDTSPGPNGEPLPNREEASFSSSRLDALTDLLKTEHTSAMLVAVLARCSFNTVT